MGLINDMTNRSYAKRDLMLFARETCGPRDDKNYCFMGMLVDDRENVVNILTGEKYHNYSMVHPSIIDKEGMAFYSVSRSSRDDTHKVTWFRLDTYDEDSVINGLIFARMNRDGTFSYNHMDKVCSYYLGRNGRYTNIDGVKEVVEELNEKIHQILIEHQKIEEDLAVKREKYARKMAEDYKK